MGSSTHQEEESRDMDLVADIKCYHCGWISGRIAGRKDTPRHLWAFEARDGSRTPLTPNKRLRCLRCNGPVFAEDMRSRELAEPLTSPALAGVAA
jgi:hypothetical protein